MASPRLLLTALLAFAASSLAADRLPNVVIIFTDDQGYGDVGVFGARGYATPNLDSLARDGVKFTNFHVAQAVCSASRAALLTGCYSNRVGIHGALGPGANHGLAATETTIAELLKTRGYATGMAGKWHLGHREAFLPNRHGFDESFGLPYSNDMWPYHPEAKAGTYPKLPLYENGRVIDPEITPEKMNLLTTRYTERAVSFIERNKERPFFFYLAHSMPHVPLAVSDKFRGKSQAGLYGDVIMEIDWSVGEVLRALDRHGLARDTLVIFTSDNGGTQQSSQEPLRGNKGCYYEGGIREPFIAYWPGVINAGTTDKTPVHNVDLYPTFLATAAAKIPAGKTLDGESLLPLFKGNGKLKRQAIFWHFPGYLDDPVLRGRDPVFRTRPVSVIRKGDWKLHLYHEEWQLDGGRYRLAPLYDVMSIWPVGSPLAGVNVPLLVSARTNLGMSTAARPRPPRFVRMIPLSSHC